MNKLTPDKLKEVVFEYLILSCQLESALAFAVEALDYEPDHSDNDAHAAGIAEQLKHAKARQTIQYHVLQGQIAEATELMNDYFPSVLLDPPGLYLDSVVSSVSSLHSTRFFAQSGASTDFSSELWSYNRHDPTPDPDRPKSPAPAERILSLDLRIQQVIESVRDAAKEGLRNSGFLSNSGMDDAASTRSNGAMSCSASSSSISTLSSTLWQTQALYKQATRLVDPNQRSYYQTLLEEVSALLIYSDLEASPVAHFLDMQRRSDLARRCNVAMLVALGQFPQPALTTIVQQTAVVWDTLVAEDGSSAKSIFTSKGLPKVPFKLGLYLDGRFDGRDSN